MTENLDRGRKVCTTNEVNIFQEALSSSCNCFVNGIFMAWPKEQKQQNKIYENEIYFPIKNKLENGLVVQEEKALNVIICGLP